MESFRTQAQIMLRSIDALLVNLIALVPQIVRFAPSQMEAGSSDKTPNSEQMADP